jgi:hypothetical protein
MAAMGDGLIAAGLVDQREVDEIVAGLALLVRPTSSFSCRVSSKHAGGVHNYDAARRTDGHTKRRAGLAQSSVRLCPSIK